MSARIPERSATEAVAAAGVAAVLVVTFVTGGGSQDFGWGDVIAQLMALPALVAASWALSGRPVGGLQRVGIAIAMGVVLLPALQLLPIPEDVWRLPPGRAVLLADLHAAGVAPQFRWTLAPAATERALWSQLPAFAAFLGALALGRQLRRQLVGVVVGLVAAGLLLGLAQLGAGQDSMLNPFPQWTPLADGVFANPNHQASALIIGAVLALGLALDRRQARHANAFSPWARWALMGIAGICLTGLPITDSRAGMLLAAPAVMTLLVFTRRLDPKRLGSGRLATGAPAVAVAAAAACLYLAVHVVRAGMDTEARWPMARATFALARDAWPLGTGIGTFPRWFEQAGPDSLLLGETINHAHNEYLQWALEGGVAAVVLAISAIAAFAVAGGALCRRPQAGVGHAAWVGVAVLLASSVVEYPLRTPALMTIGAFLAGVAIAEARPAPRHRHPVAG